MRFPHQELHEMLSVQRNFEYLQQSPFFWGSGVPTMVAFPGAFYFRTDTPTVVNQRIYVCSGSPASTWTGVL